MTRAQVISDINQIEDNGNNTASEVRTVLTDLLDFSDEGITANGTSINTLNVNVSNLTTRTVALENTVTTHQGDITTINGDINTIEDDIDVINDTLDAMGKPFHFWKENPVTDGNGNLLWYSIKGSEKRFANMTFRIQMTRLETARGMDHYFLLDAELVKIMKDFLSRFPKATDKLSFVVACNNPTLSEEKPYIKIITATIDFVEISSPKSSGVKFNFYSQTALDKDLMRVGDEIFTSIQFHCPPFNLADNPKP